MSKLGRWMLYGLGAILALLLLLYLASDSIARHATRSALDDFEGLSSRFGEVSVGLFPLRYNITKLRVFEKPVHNGDEPLFYAERIEARAAFWPLLRGQLVTDARVEDAKVAWVVRKPVKQEIDETARKLEEPTQQLVEALRRSPPIRLDRLEVLNGELVIKDERERNAPEIWVHDVDLTMENFASNRELSDGEPTILAMSATLQKTGALSLFVSSDPLALPPHFAGTMAVERLQLQDFHELIVAKAGVQIPRGELEVAATFTSREGRVRGGIKPELRGVEVKAAEKGLGNKLKAGLADAAISLAESDKEEGEKVATIIPIRGKLESPDAQFWPALLGVVRNAFVEGLAGGFAHLPPPEAGKKESILEQAKDAVSPKKGPPQAQPTAKDK